MAQLADYTAVKSEDSRVELMRKFVSVSDEIERIRDAVADQEAHLKELAGTHAQLRRELIGQIDPDSQPMNAPSR